MPSSLDPFPCDCAALFLGPVGQGECGGNLRLGLTGPDDHEINIAQIKAVERRHYRLDDLVQSVQEPFDGALLPVLFRSAVSSISHFGLL